MELKIKISKELWNLSWYLHSTVTTASYEKAFVHEQKEIARAETNGANYSSLEAIATNDVWSGWAIHHGFVTTDKDVGGLF